jgi:hypothetical protein
MLEGRLGRTAELSLDCVGNSLSIGKRPKIWRKPQDLHNVRDFLGWIVTKIGLERAM